jgi:hypothetical protein
MENKIAIYCSMFLVSIISPGALLNAAVVGFTAPFDVVNWNQSTNTRGSFDLSSAPDSIRLQGGDDRGGGGGGAFFSITLTNDYTLGFEWAFNATELPFYDPVGYSIDGVFTKLTDDFGSFYQSGSVFGLSVKSGQTFAFEARTLDNIAGPSTLTVSNFSANVPEPTSLSVFGCAVASIGLMRLRKKPKPESLYS